MKTRGFVVAGFCFAFVAAFGAGASAQVSCTGVPAFATCTAYASGASVVFNNAKYTAIAPISVTRDCPPGSPYNPSNDNWWTNNGACTGGGATPTATPTRTATPTATNGRATATARVRSTPTATATSATPTPTASTATLPKRLLIGYWHNFNNGSGFIKLRDVSPDWDIVHLAFGEPPGGTGSTIQFIPDAATSEAELKSDVAILHSRGKKVCLSIGGQNGHVELPTTADRDAFVSSVTAILNKYNLDGLDIDFEGGSVHIDGADSITNPKTAVIVNLIAAIRTIRSNTRGAGFVLTMAPETFYVQMGYYSYGGSGGAYLPLIYGMRDILTVLHVQQYNSGPIMGLDDQWHTMPAIDFHVAMAKMAISGFACPKGSSNVFPGVRPDQYAMGLPANVNAGNGYTTEANVRTAFDQVRATYPGLRGLMAWSINWDAFNGFVFSRSHRTYLNGLP
jgi:chitinase